MHREKLPAQHGHEYAKSWVTISGISRSDLHLGSQLRVALAKLRVPLEALRVTWTRTQT